MIETLISMICFGGVTGRSYAMEKGMNIPSMERTKNTNSILVSLKNQLEKVGSSLSLDIFFFPSIGNWDLGFGVDDFDVGFFFFTLRSVGLIF